MTEQIKSTFKKVNERVQFIVNSYRKVETNKSYKKVGRVLTKLENTLTDKKISCLIASANHQKHRIYLK